MSVLDRVEKSVIKIGRNVSVLILLMVIVTFLIVILRYGLGLGWVWMQEIVIYLHGIVFLVVAAATLAKDEHVRVDMIYRKKGEKYRKKVDFFGTLFFLIPVMLLIFFQSLPYVIDSWSVWEGSKDGGGLEAVFIQKTFILIFSLLMILQGLVLLKRNWPGFKKEGRK